ncbi:P-loop containing nucleoside triphosphate hydrolase protein [Chaetomium fimeti]|uniref:P-loop containing nucleoside triphosphate hydrolase protein n=1 Tax=Chaetomium fimeti TaxID=1854472 RepID=A0AAE0HDT4_9PEZI|nr:P-loop containing nucleoside triphosphate hydrolase protein [Chaetomium fimeti]
MAATNTPSNGASTGSASGTSSSAANDDAQSPERGKGNLLQSQDHRGLLDVVDRLRSQGLSRYVDLPQIIVCGDQSSGKSSALEAISGMSFPAKDNLCTRFATELILRRTPTTGIDISIRPGSERTEEEKKTLTGCKYTGTLEELDLGQVVEQAKNLMGLNGTNKVFSTDILRVEVSGPSQPHLTMVDLPGLFLAGNKDQSEQDAALVKALVLSYMKNPRTIILAVVSAKNDFALQQVTRHARAQDPEGLRTLGLITKPDTLDQGSDSERFYVELAQNKDVQFRLGWHALRNRNFAERDESTIARDAAEAEFFAKGVWRCLKPSQLGVAALRVRLSHVLRDQILWQLPSVLEDVRAGIAECRHTLDKLGTSRGTIAEQRRYLLKISARFSELVKEAVDGVYTDAFFKPSKDRRLRAAIQNTLSDFARDMRLHGHATTITDGPIVRLNGEDDRKPRAISRASYILQVKALMMESRGRELPGTYNPLIVAELFSNQCKPWQGMVRTLLERAFQSTVKMIECALHHVADGETTECLLRAIISPALESIKRGLKNKADEILEPHLSGHPITYNHYLTDNVQKAQADRRRHQMENRLKAFFSSDRIPTGVANHKFDMHSLLNDLATNTEPDMDTYSCSMAVDTMEAYYKVALKSLVDSVSTLAVERCLLQKLSAILSPEIVCELTDDAVQRIAAESPESVAERVQAAEKLAVLEDAMFELKRLGMHGTQAASDDFAA